VEVRTADAQDDTPLAQALRELDDAPTRLSVLAERALLARLEAGCAAPVGALAHLAVLSHPDGIAQPAGQGSEGGRGSEAGEGTARPATRVVLTLDAVAVRPDGTDALRLSASVELPLADHQDGTTPAGSTALAVALGTSLADRLLAGGAADLAGLGAR
jgi:hydroxymethylbilane synthase